MYDFTNYQIADIPIFMWSMVAVTAGLIGYVTVSSNPSVAASLPTLPGTPTETSAPQTQSQMGGSRRRKSHKTKRTRRH